jgi:hypothetical protein
MATTILHSIGVVNAKQRRLEQLELRAASAGMNTPPEVTIEISDLRKEIAAAAPATIAESHDILFDFMTVINTRIDRLYWWMLFLALVIILAVKL